MFEIGMLQLSTFLKPYSPTLTSHELTIGMAFHPQ